MQSRCRKEEYINSRAGRSSDQTTLSTNILQMEHAYPRLITFIGREKVVQGDPKDRLKAEGRETSNKRDPKIHSEPRTKVTEDI